MTDGVPGLEVFDERRSRRWRLVPPAAPWPPVNADAEATKKRAPLAADRSMLSLSSPPPSADDDEENEGDEEEEEEEEFAMFVNGGDMLHRWSNGVFTSALHRVALSEDVDRYSAAFFFDPPWSCVVEPIIASSTSSLSTATKATSTKQEGERAKELEGSSSSARPLFAPTTYGEYLVEKFKKTHASFEEAAGGEVERRRKKEEEDK